jgi:hypothetical protein
MVQRPTAGSSESTTHKKNAPDSSVVVDVDG